MKTAVCLYVRNEERDLAEWVAYHVTLGFDAIFVYENGSTDATWQVLQRAARTWDVRPRRWLHTHKYSHMLAYNHCLVTAARGFDWVLFIDADEFLTPTSTDNVQSFLQDFEHAGAIALNFAFYGSSGHEAFPEALVIESFTHRAPEDFGPARLTKSFVRPHWRLCKSTHYFPGLGVYADASGKAMVWGAHRGASAAPPEYSACHVNHYFTRSRAHWTQKIARGYRDITRGEEEFRQYDVNDVEDLTAARFASRTRAEMARLDKG